MNQFNIIKTYTIFTQQQDTNSIQVPIDYKPGDAGTYQPGDKTWVSCTVGRFFTNWVTLEHIQKQGAKTSWPESIEIMQSLFSYPCGIMLEINIKRYSKINHIFSSAMWHLPREIFDLAIESLGKVKTLKKQRVIAEKKAFKWEINIKDTFKK